MAALNAGRTISRTVKLTAHDLLVATRRDTGGDSYARLRDGFERLAGTRITTNLVTGEQETTSGFGLIEGWEIVRKSRGGRMISVTVTLSDWLFRAVQSKSVLTLSRDYFSLRKPLERRIYELARKHCGQQRRWRASVATLHTKAGSDAPLRVFRAALRRMIEDDNLPDYEISEDDGDVMVITRKRLVEDNSGLPVFDADTLDEARIMAPGWDIYALEAEWRGFWVASGRQKLAHPDRAFLGWLRGRITR